MEFSENGREIGLQRLEQQQAPDKDYSRFDWPSPWPPARMAAFGESQEARSGSFAMNDNLSFGLTMTIVGAAGTMLSLWLLSLLTTAIKKVFPVAGKKHAHGAEK
jgi:hypothetical protein